jgi:hypothetical protein
VLSWYVFVLSHRAQDCDYSHEDPSRPSDCTEVTAVVHPIEGDGLEHKHRSFPLGFLLHLLLPPQQAGCPYAHKINRCLMSVHALRFFGLGTCFWRCACSRLPAAAAAACCLPPASMCVAHGRANTWHISARCHGTDVGGVSLAAGKGEVWPGARKEHASGRRKYFLLCELAIGGWPEIL